MAHARHQLAKVRPARAGRCRTAPLISKADSSAGPVRWLTGPNSGRSGTTFHAAHQKGHGVHVLAAISGGFHGPISIIILIVIVVIGVGVIAARFFRR